MNLLVPLYMVYPCVIPYLLYLHVLLYMVYPCVIPYLLYLHVLLYMVYPCVIPNLLYLHVLLYIVYPHAPHPQLVDQPNHNLIPAASREIKCLFPSTNLSSLLSHPAIVRPLYNYHPPSQLNQSYHQPDLCVR